MSFGTGAAVEEGKKEEACASGEVYAPPSGAELRCWIMRSAISEFTKLFAHQPPLHSAFRPSTIGIADLGAVDLSSFYARVEIGSRRISPKIADLVLDRRVFRDVSELATEKSFRLQASL